MMPRSGDVLRLSRAASPQFRQPLILRLIRVQDLTCAEGWAWLDGYQLDEAGQAVERRSVFVLLRGVQRAQAHLQPGAAVSR